MSTWIKAYKKSIPFHSSTGQTTGGRPARSPTSPAVGPAVSRTRTRTSAVNSGAGPSSPGTTAVTTAASAWVVWCRPSPESGGAPSRATARTPSGRTSEILSNRSRSKLRGRRLKKSSYLRRLDSDWRSLLWNESLDDWWNFNMHGLPWRNKFDFFVPFIL